MATLALAAALDPDSGSSGSKSLSFAGSSPGYGVLSNAHLGLLISGRSIQVQAMRCRRSFRRNLFCRGASLTELSARWALASRLLFMMAITLDDPIQADALRPLFRGKLEAPACCGH